MVTVLNSEFIFNLNQIKRMYIDAFKTLADETGYNQNQLDILLFLANNPTYDTAAQISQYRNMVKSQVSSSIARLTADGLISAEDDETDKRARKLTLTKTADEVTEKALVIQKTFVKKIFAGFSADEIRDLRTLADKLMTNVKEGSNGLD